jgi:hypothetical protein
MSGPKGYSVHVESSEERLRRLTDEAQARCGALSDRLAGLGAVAGDEAVGCAAPREGTLDQLRAWEERLGRAISRAEEIVARREAQARLAAMVSTVGVESLRAVSLGEMKSKAAPARSVGSGGPDLAGKVAGLLGRASEVGDQAVVESLAAQAKTVMGLSGAALSRGWMELESNVAAAVKADRASRRCRDGVEAELLRLAHLDGPGVDEVKMVAAAVTDQGGLQALRGEVARVLAEAEREADAAFVTAQARLALADLGYVVDEPFEAVGQAGDVFLAHRRDLPDHALQVRVNEGTKTMLTSVVAAEGTSPAADAAAEAATCGDVTAFTEAMARRGVRADPVFHRVPGVVAVEHSLRRSAAPAKEKPKKVRRVRPKAMGLRP